MNLKAEQLKPLLHEALDRYPVYRENCLRWRDRLLQLYDINRLLDILQDQAHGHAIPEGYLKPDVKEYALPAQSGTPTNRPIQNNKVAE